MKGDFSRLTFDAAKHRNRVLLQQGRVMLDSDWNEQVAILVDRLETLVRDLIGPAAAPAADPGFEIDDLGKPAQTNFRIGKGRLYVDGLLCENPVDTTYLGQPFPGGETDLKPDGSYLVYVDAWEQLIAPFDDPMLQEPALAGLDGPLRTGIVWQVRVEKLPEQEAGHVWDQQAIEAYWPQQLAKWQQPADQQPTLKVRIGDPSSPIHRSQRRSLQNRLYRVEIHGGGRADKNGRNPATLKWSRENGSVLLPLYALDGTTATLMTAPTDTTILRTGEWVELVHPATLAQRKPGPLLQIQSMGPEPRTLTLAGEVPGDFTFEGGARSDVALRRWDQQQAPGTGGTALVKGAVPITPSGTSGWIPLEHGIEVQIDDNGHDLRPHDYWIFATRTADGGCLLWPSGEGQAEAAAPPAGVDHRYAPLAAFTPATMSTDFSYRKVFSPLATLADDVATLRQDNNPAK